MCGLAGIWAYRKNAPPVQEEELIRMSDAMVSRGPDGDGLWLGRESRLGLVHRRLSIIDLSDAGAQPMVTEDEQLRIVFNGEIFNYRELRDRLEKKGYRFRSQSDTEVLLHLYAEKGQAMVEDLRGMFAFALWDESKHGLYLARDPFGIKPLYYADDGYTFRMASQVKALLAGGGITTTYDPAGHVGFFLWGSVPEPYTLYKGIRALPAGSTCWVDKSGRREAKNFCTISDELSRVEKANMNVKQEEIRERLRTALLDSLKAHLIADVPVGVFLSSGLDSTTLTALASEVAGRGLYTITLGFKEYLGTESDESVLAELVAKQYGAIHRTYWLSAGDFRADFNRLTAAMDQPTIDGANTYFVSKVAAASGLKVALSGLGGDELFGGYPSFRQIPQIVRTLSAGRYCQMLGRAIRWVSAPWLKHFTSSKYAGLLEYGSNFGGAYLLRRGLFMPWELPEVLDGEMVREGWRELQPLLRLEETIRGIDFPHFKVSALEMEWYMRNQLLRDADWAGMAHSLEIRVPLVDVELLRTIAPLFKKNLPTKLDMALTPGKALPNEILNRRKTGFSVPVHEWLLQEGVAQNTERGLRGWAKTVYAANTNIQQ